MDLLVKNGALVTATDTFRADILVAGEKIVQIGQSLDADPSARVVDATGRYVMPAGIDPHTHLASPGQGTTTADDYLTGTIAAACGATTSIVNFAFQANGAPGIEERLIFTYQGVNDGKLTLNRLAESGHDRRRHRRQHGGLAPAWRRQGKGSVLPNSRILIHQASSGFQGTAADIEVQARELLRLEARVQELVAAERPRASSRSSAASRTGRRALSRTAVVAPKSKPGFLRSIR